MNVVNNDDANNQTNWPRRREKKVKKTVQIRDAKVKGLEHTNHKNQAVAARATGADCRYALVF
jgi:hypothetical protein